MDERLIEWTGERCVPWADDYQIIYEHYHRYAFALSYACGRRVLDLASGEGFGAALMATRAAEVVGADLDDTTVAHARARYRLDNLRFVVGSITDPSLLAGEEPFDVITCFEAIEHVVEQQDLMRLVRARLAPDGVLLCSTPDVEVYTHEHGERNPYHVRELTESAFRDLLGATFEHVSLLRQNVAVGSLLHGGPEKGGAEVHTLTGTDGRWELSQRSPHTYLFGVASARPHTVPETSVLVDPDLNLVARHRADEVAELGSTVTELRDRLERAERDFAEERKSVRCHAVERDEALSRATRAEGQRRDAARDNEVLRGRIARNTARIDWLADTNSALRRRLGELETENATLREQQSALAQRLVGRYRAAVERFAPRGTVLRNAYEAALGRPTGAVPAATDADTARVEDSTPVTVTTSDQPIVSVIVPVYGKWSYTRRCLASIDRHLPATPFEVIVVDDASPDGSADLVEACGGVRLVRAEANQGFVAACNLGAEWARGEFLLFLNNDTEVHDGWLDELVSVLDMRPEVGLVGSKLVYPDGTLQECGGIVWADGSGWNYGRGERADAPRFGTLREVDYCSGAALMVRRGVFVTVGGFDSGFAPAYYEDTDLAFAVRAAGHRTMVQPASVVTHHEGVSHGTDTRSGVKRYQEANRVRFAEKWAEALRSHRSIASPRNVWVGSVRTTRGHGGGFVLVVDHQVPRPDEDSGSVRMFRLLRLLAELDQRVVFFPVNHHLPARHTAALQREGITVLGDRDEQDEFVRVAGSELRLAVLSRPQVAWAWLETLREHAAGCVVAYDTVDLHYVRLGRQAELAGELGDTDERFSLSRRAEAVREQELGLARVCDVTFTVSDTERDLLTEAVPSARVEVLSNVHDVNAASASPSGRSGVLFVGGFDHRPNRDAARWLAEEVMPRVHEWHPDAVAHIVGSNPPPAVRALESESVVVHGWVRDLVAMYDEARVVTAPLRFGAGVKGKVGEALAHGVPVAATTVAVEGMNLVDGTDILVGDTADLLADHIARLLGDDLLWSRLSDAGRDAVRARFGPDVARKTLGALLAEIEDGPAIS